MKKKYIFLDIDGTLVTGAAVPESAHEALVRAKNAGHELILCTGRSLCEIFPFLLEDFEFDGIISSSGGAVKRGGYECIHAIGENDCAELCGYFDEKQIPYTVMTGEETYYTFAEYMGSSLAPVEQIDYYCGDEETAHVVSRFGGRLNVIPSEITAKGISKASGILEYISVCKADICDAAAFGDSENDIEMIRCAGVGVAMGNASDGLKAVADYVTDDVDRDGLEKAFEALGLI